jgi:hypothetical protein
VAYPFIHCPSWREVIDRLDKEHQIAFHQTPPIQTPEGKPLQVADGEDLTIQYFEHKTDAETFRSVVSFVDENERILPSMMRSICASLRISPAFFGLELG